MFQFYFLTLIPCTLFISNYFCKTKQLIETSERSLCARQTVTNLLLVSSTICLNFAGMQVLILLKKIDHYNFFNFFFKKVYYNISNITTEKKCRDN